MKNSYKVLGIVGVVVVLCFLLANHTITLHENVLKQKSYLSAAYQERADLVPNLVSTVKAAADHESDVFVSIAEARQSLNDAIASGNDESMQKAESELTRNINIMVEAYPTLTANQNFISLQDQLEGTENRIRVARNYYSDSVNAYNGYIKRFPGNLISGIMGYDSVKYYEADINSETAPVVNYD